MRRLGYPPPFVEPAYRWVPPGGLGSYGDEVVGFARAIGMAVDPEQAQAIGDFATFGPGGLYLAPETCMIEGRQNGKTMRVGLPIALFDVFVRGLRDPDGRGDVLTWTAHVLDTTLATFAAVKRLIDEFPELSRRVRAVSDENGHEGVELTDGSAMEFRTRSLGRGRSGQIWVADEWLEGTTAQVGTRMPTLRTRPGAQLRFYSSAGLAKSAELRKLVRRGRAGGDPGLIYVEYCGPGSFAEPGCELDGCTHVYGTPGCVLDREEHWHEGSHATGRRVTYAWQRTERRRMDPVEFAREIFGWHEQGDDEDRPISDDDWAAVVRPLGDLERRRLGPPVFWLDVSPGSRSAAIAAAADLDGRPHVELADGGHGIGWLVERCEELAEAHPGALWAYDGDSKATAATAPELEFLDLEAMPRAEIGRAFAHLERLAHQRDWSRSPDAGLEVAFRAGVRRTLGDAGSAWGRRKSTGDICRLVAVTGALWLLASRGNGDPLQNIR